MRSSSRNVKKNPVSPICASQPDSQLLFMKQIQVKITQEWEWLIIHNRAVKLVTTTSQSCYCFQLSSPGHRTWAACSKTAAETARPCPQPACSFVAQQDAAAMTAGLALGRATDCKASGDTRAMCMWQNMLQCEEASCLLHYGKADCIALALVTTGHSLCGTTSHTENVQMQLVGPI